jgi:hypothetical protein
MTDIKTLHAQHRQRYELINPPPGKLDRENWQKEYAELNPRPAWSANWTMLAIQFVATLGATLLSATRVGYSLSLVGAFEKFGDAVHLPIEAWKLSGFESIAGVATIEGALLTAGLFWGTQAKKIDEQWFKVMIYIAGFIALASNLSPVAVLFSKSVEDFAAIAVNIIVGLGTPFLVIIGGKILSTNYFGGKHEYDTKLKDWQATMREDWNEIKATYKTNLANWKIQAGSSFQNSEEYRQRPRANQNAAQEKDLVRLLNAQPGHIMPVQDAAVGLNILPKDIWQITSGSLVTETAGTDVRLTNGNIKSG